MQSASGSRWVCNGFLQGVACVRLHIVCCNMMAAIGGGDRGSVSKGATGCTPLLALCLFLGGLCDSAVFSGAGPTFEGEIWACGDGGSVVLCHCPVVVVRLLGREGDCVRWQGGPRLSLRGGVVLGKLVGYELVGWSVNCGQLVLVSVVPKPWECGVPRGIVGVEDVLESRSAVGVVVGEGALRWVLR